MRFNFYSTCVLAALLAAEKARALAIEEDEQKALAQLEAEENWLDNEEFNQLAEIKADNELDL